jgi:tetratricopeptide (TPR) repeat protein/predicted Ser/Thr protein kinase
MIGQTVSHYRIIEKLGEGGMGVVYLAEDKHLARRVAIKFLSSTDHHYRARFIREARAVSALNHPNIATVHDYGETDEDQPFIVMEYVKGTILSDLLDQGLTLRRSVEVIIAIGEALAEAHENGIVHRDIKPSNVVVNERGQVKVLDFGLVKHLFDQPGSGVDLDAKTLYSTQTRSDVIVGTPLYLSPEQATGKQIDGRSDLFALGALLYECLAGQSAFSGGSVLEIGAQIIHVMPPPPSQVNPRVPAVLDQITMRLLEKKAAARYQSAAELVTDLKKALAGLSGESEVVAIRINRSGTDGIQNPTNAFATFTMSLRRERFSITSVAAVVLVTVAAILAVIYFWPKSYYQPTPAALDWYNIGTRALRNGAYYQASRALEQAISIDGNYALAHARLAQAWTELDYSDKAKDELLKVANRNKVSPIDALYLDAITASVRRDFSAAAQSYLEIAKLSPDDTQVFVDLGYAYENGDKLDKAIENYEKAIGMSSGQDATAFLRAGSVYARTKETDKALDRFAVAEKLYRAATNNEGTNEVLRRRGILFRAKGRYDDARAQFEQSLDGSKFTGYEAQKINALLELSYLTSTHGRVAEAEQFANQAVTFAQQNHLENLTANGLLELGNAASNRGDRGKAEEYFDQAIRFAQENKGRWTEARGKSNLGGLYIETLRIDDGMALVRQSLAFFQQGNYPRNVPFCLTQIGRGYRRKGDYPAALEVLNQKLALAKQGDDPPEIADTYGEIAAVLFDQENYPAALAQYESALKIYEGGNNTLRMTYAIVNRINTLWRLGRYDEAQKAIEEVSEAVNSNVKQLIPTLSLIKAHIHLSQGDLAAAMTDSNQAIAQAGTQSTDIAIEAKYVLGLVKARSSGGKDAVKLCEESAKMANDAGELALLARALLAQAEASLKSKDAQGALTLALQSQEKFAKGGQLESEWRAWLMAARVSQELGDQAKADEYYKNARDVRSRMEQQWGVDAFKGYILRPDIQVNYKELG